METVLFILKLLGIGAAKKAGEKIAEPIMNKINSLFDVIRKKFQQKQIEGILNDAQKDPSENNKDLLKTFLEKQMSEDQNFAKEVEKIVKDLKADEQIEKILSKAEFMTNIHGKQGTTVKTVDFQSQAEQVNALSGISSKEGAVHIEGITYKQGKS